MLSFFSIIVFIPGCNPGSQEDNVLQRKINERKTFNGKCLMILQSQLEKGVITVEASSEGIKSAKIKLSTL